MIRAERHGDVLALLLSRSEKRNALTPEMLDALRSAIASAPGQGARALLLSGDGRTFCGGFDLALCARQDGVLASLLVGLFETVALLRSLPIPVVVGAQGAAIAGGCALLGGADVVVTNRGAKLGYPVTPLGISPAVSAPFLRLGIGNGPCRARLLEPTLISGAEALRIGLVHELTGEPEDVRPHAAEVAASLAAKPRIGVEAMRRWLAEVEAALSAADPRQGLETSLGLAGSEAARNRLRKLFG